MGRRGRLWLNCDNCVAILISNSDLVADGLILEVTSAEVLGQPFICLGGGLKRMNCKTQCRHLYSEDPYVCADVKCCTRAYSSAAVTSTEERSLTASYAFSERPVLRKVHPAGADAAAVRAQHVWSMTSEGSVAPSHIGCGHFGCRE